MISFQHPFFLLLIFIFPLYYFLKNKYFKSLAFEFPIMNWNGRVPKIKNAIRLIYFCVKSCFILAMLFLIIAISNPVQFKSEKAFSGAGHSIMFVIDISPSMAANDMNGSTRLNTAKQVIRNFAEKHKGNSLGLTAVASTAGLLVPPTIDYNTFLTRLDSLQVGELGKGTAIGMGLATAVFHSVKSMGNRTYIILLTDGENNTGEIHPKTAANIIKERGIEFYVIGLGKTGYSEVEYFDVETQKQIHGTLYTDFSESNLEDIAVYGNGRYAYADSPEALTETFKSINDAIPLTSSSFSITVERNLSSEFLKLALILFAVVWFIWRVLLGAII